MLFMLTALYRLRDAEERLRRGEARSGPPRARMLKGKTVGIIGYGNIAKALISRLAGWDARILVSNRSKLPSPPGVAQRSEEHTSELQSLMRISYAVFCLK